MNPNVGRTPDKDGVYFSVTTLMFDDNRTLGRGVKDKDGYYTDVPVAVLDVKSRNKTLYKSEPFMKQLSSPDSSFRKRLEEGVLAGELSHPFVNEKTEAGLKRLMTIDLQKQSHHIRTIKAKHLNDLGIDIVMMDAKGAGPYRDCYEDAMSDPTRNVAFSLRGLSRGVVDRATGVITKSLIALATFDMVPGGGFREASKRYMASKEDLSYSSEDVIDFGVTTDDILMVRNVSLESFSDTELNELLKASKVVIGTTTIGYVDKQRGTVLNNNTREHRGMFHEFSKVKR